LRIAAGAFTTRVAGGGEKDRKRDRPHGWAIADADLVGELAVETARPIDVLG